MRPEANASWAHEAGWATGEARSFQLTSFDEELVYQAVVFLFIQALAQQPRGRGDGQVHYVLAQGDLPLFKLVSRLLLGAQHEFVGLLPCLRQNLLTLLPGGSRGPLDELVRVAPCQLHLFLVADLGLPA